MLCYLQNKNERDYALAFIQKVAQPSVANYMVLWRKAKRLNIAHQRILGTEIDLQNILWIYRLKRFYQMFDSRVYSHLVPVRHRLAEEVIEKMVTGRDVASLQSALAATTYAHLFGQFFAPNENFLSPEKTLQKLVRQLYKKESRHCHLALLCHHLMERG